MIHFSLFIIFVLVFIGGMSLLRLGLFNLSESSLKKHLARVTGTPLKGLAAGSLVTAFLHSSSAVMVITISLISAGMLTFRQSIGVILGSNIGTTFTLELITINIDIFIVPLAVLGAGLMLASKATVRNTGKISFGIAAVFAAMRGFSYLAGPLTNLPAVGALLEKMDSSHFWAILCAAVITAIIQSSTAMTGIVMGFLSQGLLGFDAALAAMLGANVGTCATALLAAAGSGKEARLTAYAHLWLNIGGMLFFYPFIDSYAAFAPVTADRPEVQLAHASVFFNLVSSLAVLPFADKFAKMVVLLHGRKKND
ncbi:Na/Pi symporter [Mesobacillus zeae]|uniref:Na/Pi cotransporter family protein n=1 Tax=Mesobacillus zeae TaxID=1917180 RepID=A0A398B4Q0_9BACI|nr:Na/Pi symporter [Mesobacillus zeae]RID83798.1 Na/Pi cotransporter family protein [Mesobacillus zeae]